MCFFAFFGAKIWPAAAGPGELARDLRDQTPELWVSASSRGRGHLMSSMNRQLELENGDSRPFLLSVNTKQQRLKYSQSPMSISVLLLIAERFPFFNSRLPASRSP